jgi:hypothetical protein
MLNNLLVYRLIVVNACAAAMLFWAWAQGHIQTVILGDDTKITYAIIALFAAGMWSILARAYRVTLALNTLKRGGTNRINPEKFVAKGDHIDEIATWLVTLGLIGTVVGFIIALSAMSGGNLVTAQGVQQMIGKMTAGMQVAIYTTLVGSVLGFWLEVNKRILKTATICMLTDNEDALDTVFYEEVTSEVVEPKA